MFFFFFQANPLDRSTPLHLQETPLPGFDVDSTDSHSPGTLVSNINHCFSAYVMWSDRMKTKNIPAYLTKATMICNFQICTPYFGLTCIFSDLICFCVIKLDSPVLQKLRTKG